MVNQVLLCENKIFFFLIFSSCDRIKLKKGEDMQTGIIVNDNFIAIANDDIESYLEKQINADETLSQLYAIFIQWFRGESVIIEFCVKYLGYAVIWNNAIHMLKGFKSPALDKLAYVREGFKLETKFPVIFQNDRILKVIDPIEAEIEKIGYRHSISPENELAFWYPKTKDLGFKTPESLIVSFTKAEIDSFHSGKLNIITEEELLARVTAACPSEGFFNQDLFARFGASSNKFNFASCHIASLSELSSKLKVMLNDMYFRLEWNTTLDLVLREFIKPSYQRATIYNGMPLNTEFRAFYDFDTNELLGIFNYWDQDTMLDNLYKVEDRVTFASTSPEIEADFARLCPSLEEQVKRNMPSCELTGKWSIDFMYDGENFVLIDMAHAECSYYYDEVLRRQRAKLNH